MRISLVVAFFLFALSSASAQAPRGITVRVRVVDSANAPLENVAIGIVRGLNESLASGPTDRNGVRVLRLDIRPDEFQVIARRVGYKPVAKAFAREDRDSIRVDVTLQRITQQLDVVRVTAEQSLRKQRQTVDADAIATFEKPLIDATDIISKMRPDMVYGVGGRDMCPAAQNIWVNGTRIDDASPTAMMEAKQRDFQSFADNVRRSATTLALSSPPRPGLLPPRSTYYLLPIEVLSVLARIKPEHIQAIEMHDCMDKSIDKKGGDAAIFVTLKDGVRYDERNGSHVGSSTAADSILMAITLPGRVAAQRNPPIIPESAAPLEAFRLRILGLFDASTGMPIAAADVTDVATGVHAATTETGTVSLAFLPVGPGRIVVSKDGYRSDTLTVKISPADTLPLTVLLNPRSH